MITGEMLQIVRDSLFMCYVLTLNGVTTHFDKDKLISVYHELLDRDLVVDYITFCCSQEDHELKND